jgi:uncharacterized protein involved in type VI secretion and phage assembly
VNVFDLLTDQTGLEARRGKVYGVVVGIVTNNQDPDNLARVKVRFPWLSADEESQWARVAAFGAGAGRGGWFLPEVDDEVLVAFEHGDVRFPYVLGGLWNGVDPGPRDNGDGENNLRVITSRSGHELVLDDSAGAERVEIHTAGGHKVILDDAPGGERIVVEDGGGANRIEIDAAAGAVAVEAQMKLSLKAPMVEIEAGTTMSGGDPGDPRRPGEDQLTIDQGWRKGDDEPCHLRRESATPPATRA